ncbi:MAG: SDR family oxidoreductase [Bacteroidetes bacterium]|nr:SDR family oxidoreductase [Bacteroidota bacterium]
MSFAVITGATHGMGKAIAEKFLSHGFSLAICSRNETELNLIRTEWLKLFPQANIIARKVDLTQKEAVIDFATEIKSSIEKIDVLVNNAGTFIPGKICEEPDGQLEKMISTNLYSAYHLTRALVPHLSALSHIFNICSIASLRAYENGGAYSISKYALLGFSENLRLELMDKDIKVTSVMPGATWGRSWENSGVDQHRMMQTSDIADMIWAAYHLSPAANTDHILIRPLKGDI